MLTIRNWLIVGVFSLQPLGFQQSNQYKEMLVSGDLRKKGKCAYTLSLPPPHPLAIKLLCYLKLIPMTKTHTQIY